MRDEERILAISTIEDEIARDPERLAGMADWTVSYLGGGVYSRWLFTSPDMPDVRAIVETSPHAVHRVTFEGLPDDAPDEAYIAALFARPDPGKSGTAPAGSAGAPPEAKEPERQANPWDETNYSDGQVLGDIARSVISLPHN